MGLKIAAKYLRLEDKELLQRTYESSIDEKKLPAKQYPSAEGIKTILNKLAVKEPRPKPSNQANSSMRFVEEFDKSSYTDSLYGRKK
ncbi:MAG: hypothetical protein ACXWZE_20550 [Candidatus Binatia bacterium]